MKFAKMFARRINGQIIGFTDATEQPLGQCISDATPMDAALIEDGDAITYKTWAGAIQDDDGISHGGHFEIRNAVAVVTIIHYEPENAFATLDGPTATSKSTRITSAADENGRIFQSIHDYYGISGYPVYNVQPASGTCGYEPKTPEVI